MNTQLLIDAIVKQTTVLIAQLATSGGLRAPLAHIANQVFLDLATELEAQGVSRKVSADMFGMALRAYLRKIQRLSESKTDRGQTLWAAVYEHLKSDGILSRRAILQRFHRDDEVLVRGVLHDLTESGLVFVSGTGPRAMFRAATEEELGQMAGNGDDTELLRAIVFRHGPLSLETLAELTLTDPAALAPRIERLVAEGRVVREETDAGPIFSADSLVVPLSATAGWEAAVFDHYHALVQTLCRKLQIAPRAAADDETGASTYTFEIWPGHPHHDDVVGTLARFREQYTALRGKVRQYNDTHDRPPTTDRVVLYAGQYVSEVER